jgi:hypothetical protein
MEAGDKAIQNLQDGEKRIKNGKSLQRQETVLN